MAKNAVSESKPTTELYKTRPFLGVGGESAFGSLPRRPVAILGRIVTCFCFTQTTLKALDLLRNGCSTRRLA